MAEQQTFPTNLENVNPISTNSNADGLNNSQFEDSDTNKKVTSLVIYFAPNYLKKALVSYNPSSEKMMRLSNESLVELYPSDSIYSKPNKPFSKREQCNISDTIRGWVKEIEKENRNSSNEEKIKVDLVVHPLVRSIEGTDSIFKTLKSQLGIEAEQYSTAESSRQAFLGIKSNLVDERTNTKICYINVCKDHIDLVFGDKHKLNQTVQINFGIQQIADSITTLRKNQDQESLILFVKANLYRFIEQVRFHGKAQLITFDENTAKLLSKALSPETINQKKAQRMNAEWIQQLCYKVIDSESQYLKSKFDWISSNSLDYASAHLILVGFLLEGLGTNICYLDTESRIRGHVLNKQLEEDNADNLYLSHKTDWKKSAQDKLIHLNPRDFSRSTQLTLLANKIFKCTHSWLHLWDEKDKKILWLSAFFSGTLTKMEPELALNMIHDLKGVSLSECRLITSIIAISCTTNLSGQSMYLELLPPEYRSKVRKMASIIQIVKALDVTGRSAVQDIQIMAKPKSSDKAILKVVPRLNSSPELIQLNVLKRTFENQFEQKIEVQVEGISTELTEEKIKENELMTN